MPREDPDVSALLRLLMGADARPSDRVISLAERFGVASVLLARLEASRALEALDAPARRSLASAAAETHALGQALRADVHVIARELMARGAYAVFLKGTPLLLADYPASMGRHLDDIDLETSVDALPSLLLALEAAGCAPARRIAHDGAALDARDPAAYRPHEAPPVWTGPLGTPIDLHVRPRRAERELRELSLEGAALLAPARPRLLIELSEHVLEHHGGAPHYLPRHLVDLSVLEDHLGRAAVQAIAAQSPSLAQSLRWLSLARGERVARSSADARLIRIAKPSLTDRLRLGANQRAHRLAELSRLARSTPGAVIRQLVPHRRYMEALYGERTSRLSRFACHLDRLSRSVLPTQRIDRPWLVKPTSSATSP